MCESQADSDVRRVSKPGPDLAFPTYVVSDPDRGVDDLLHHHHRFGSLFRQWRLDRRGWKLCLELCFLGIWHQYSNLDRDPSPPGSVVMFDPRTRGGGGGTAQITAPREGVAAWTGAPPLSPKAVPQSVPARVSVVLVEETPGRSARKLPSAPNSENW